MSPHELLGYAVDGAIAFVAGMRFESYRIRRSTRETRREHQ